MPFTLLPAPPDSKSFENQRRKRVFPFSLTPTVLNTGIKWTKNDAKIDKTSFISKVKKSQNQFFLFLFFQKCNEKICLILPF